MRYLNLALDHMEAQWAHALLILRGGEEVFLHVNGYNAKVSANPEGIDDLKRFDLCVSGITCCR